MSGFQEAPIRFSVKTAHIAPLKTTPRLTSPYFDQLIRTSNDQPVRTLEERSQPAGRTLNDRPVRAQCLTGTAATALARTPALVCVVLRGSPRSIRRDPPRTMREDDAKARTSRRPRSNRPRRREEATRIRNRKTEGSRRRGIDPCSHARRRPSSPAQRRRRRRSTPSCWANGA